MSQEKYKAGDFVSHNDRDVGEVEQRMGLTVFRWFQHPFRAFSNQTTFAYGMSAGLAEKLEESNIDVVEVENGELIPTGSLSEYELIERTNSVFNEMPEESQYLIRVEK